MKLGSHRVKEPSTRFKGYCLQPARDAVPGWLGPQWSKGRWWKATGAWACLEWEIHKGFLPDEMRN